MTTKISNISVQSRQYIDCNIYLVGEIGAPENYLEEFQTLRDAKQGEEISIILNTDGGRIDTAVQFVSLIRECEANVTAILEGKCHSAGTLLFLAAHQWVVKPHSIMLVHNYSGGSGGKGSEILDHAQATNSWIRDIMGDLYTGFLSEEEINEVAKNQDIWLRTDEILERLHKVVEYRELLAEIQEEEFQKALLEKAQELSNKE